MVEKMDDGWLVEKKKGWIKRMAGWLKMDGW